MDPHCPSSYITAKGGIIPLSYSTSLPILPSLWKGAVACTGLLCYHALRYVYHISFALPYRIKLILLTIFVGNINEPVVIQIGKPVARRAELHPGLEESCLFLHFDKWHQGSSRGNWGVTVTDKEHNYHTMMKEPWWELVAPLITVLFPPASNVRKNTQWHVCKRASTKLLSGKINGGSCSPHSDLRGQLVTAPWRCWGQQCSGSVSWRDGERHPHAPPTLGGEKKKCRRMSSVLLAEWPLYGGKLISSFCCC